jgi:methyltransferase (TIGR00027 family)
LKDGKASRTAEYMALFRAVEHELPSRTRLFADPIAGSLLSGMLSAAVQLAHYSAGHRLVTQILDSGWPGTRSSAVVRTRLIDDVVSEAVVEGAGQLLILGAGLDTRAHRLAALKHAKVFEVDHSATQQAKRERLQDSRSVALRDDVHYVPMNFEHDDLEQKLADGGFQKSLRTVAIWEGVISYLSAEAVACTFAALGRLLSHGSRLVFTYVDRRALEGTLPVAEAKRWKKQVEASGEPFVFGFDPEELPSHLSAYGFVTLFDQSTGGAAKQFAVAGAREEAGSEFYRVAACVRQQNGNVR